MRIYLECFFFGVVCGVFYWAAQKFGGEEAFWFMALASVLCFYFLGGRHQGMKSRRGEHGQIAVGVASSSLGGQVSEGDQVEDDPVIDALVTLRWCFDHPELVDSPEAMSALMETLDDLPEPVRRKMADSAPDFDWSRWFPGEYENTLKEAEG